MPCAWPVRNCRQVGATSWRGDDGHGDHFFGLNTIFDAFPHARVITAAAVVPEAQGQLSPELMQFWNAIFPGQIPEHPIVPDALDGDVIDLEATASHHHRRAVGHERVDDRSHLELGRPHRRRRRLQRHPPVAGTDRPREAAAVDREASSRSRRSSPTSSSPATRARTYAMTTRPPFSAPPRPTSATSTHRFPRAVRPGPGNCGKSCQAIQCSGCKKHANIMPVATLQVKDVPDDLHRELRRRADLDGLSIRDYLLRLIRNDQQRPPATEWMARLRRLEPLDLGAPAADLIRADRAARDLEASPEQRQS